MKFQTALVVAALTLVASTATAQSVQTQPQLPPLSTETFAALNLYILPSSNFSPGWDSIKSVPVAEHYLIRLFYRKIDGLLVGVMEDRNGVVTGQSRAWLIGTNQDQLDLTPLVGTSRPGVWSAELIVFAYNRTSGIAIRRELFWEVVIQPTAR